MNWLNRNVLPLTGAVLIAFCSPLYSQDAPEKAEPGPPPIAPPESSAGVPTDVPTALESPGANGEVEIPLENQDSGFDGFANLGMLATAWRQLDAPLVTDVALRFAEGERVLLRPHNSIATGQVFDLAIRLATQKQDKETLTRLASVFEKNGDAQRLEQVNLSMQVAGTARSNDPSLDEGTLEQLEAIRSLKSQIEAARIIGDKESLKNAESRLVDVPVTDQQRAALNTLLVAATESLPEQEQEETLQLVNKLSGASRALWDAQPDVWGTIRTGSNGQMYRENFWFWKDRIFVIDKWRKGWVGEVVVEKGHMVMRQSSEYVKVLWNPIVGQRKLANGLTVYVNPNDLNTIHFLQRNGSWSTNYSLTQLLEKGKVDGDKITVSLPPNLANLVAAGGGNLVAAGGGNYKGPGGKNLPAGIIAATTNGNLVVPRPGKDNLTGPVLFQRGRFIELPGKR